MLVSASGLSEAHVRYAARYELARTAEDVLARRNRALFLDSEAAMLAAPEVARILAEELGHDAAWQQRAARPGTGGGALSPALKRGISCAGSLRPVRQRRPLRGAGAMGRACRGPRRRQDGRRRPGAAHSRR